MMGETLYNSIRDTLEINDNFVEICARASLDMYGPQLLRDSKKRSIIIRVLFDDEAFELAKLLNLQVETTPHKALIDTRFTKNSTKERILFDFFEMEQPPDEVGEIFPDVETVSGDAYSLFDYQRNVLIEALDCYHSGSRNSMMIQMPTGSGKTRVAMNLISRILLESRTVILWLAYSEELCEQAIQEFKKAWSNLGDRTVSISRLYGKHNFVEIDDGLIVAGLSKMWRQNERDIHFLHNIAIKTSAIVFDEAHQAIADTYLTMISTIRMYNDRCALIGLSATPGRTDDDETDALTNMFDNNIIKLKVDEYDSPIDYLYDFGYLSRPTFTQLTTRAGVKLSEYSDENSNDYGINILKAVGSNSERNNIIVDTAMNAISNKGHMKVLIFAASVDSAKYLMFKLNYAGYKTYIITSETDSSLRRKSLNEFKEETEQPVIMCNYGVMTTGVDIPTIDCVIIARPTKSLILYSQMVGRGIRGPTLGGTDEAEIITVADIDLPGYGSVIQAFNNWDNEWRQ